ncbi:Uncharacterized protein APZ42_017908 [Daphnia magna]|uniref:Uncharacterized protein n=1 Tax=Daphnia magna TaxID=35525 RepID=A0A164ZEH9_9CRUS|nr:Uncharacterized protein APZ42_017908 [Daphnia magna]
MVRYVKFLLFLKKKKQKKSFEFVQRRLTRHAYSSYMGRWRRELKGTGNHLLRSSAPTICGSPQFSPPK